MLGILGVQNVCLGGPRPLSSGPALASDSAIGPHFLQNPTCTQHYDDSRFSFIVLRTFGLKATSSEA